MKAFKTENTVTEVKFKKIGDEGLHGDVIISKIDMTSEFGEWPIVKDHCLAYGEATGHAHKLFDGEFELREDPKTKTRHLRVVKECFLRHQEHNPVAIPPGEYRIGIQREYDPFEKLARRVTD